MSDIEKIINDAWENKDQINPNSDKKIKDTINQIIADLDSGKVRVAEKINGEWITHQHIKKAIMLSFRIYENDILSGPYSVWRDRQFLLKGKFQLLELKLLLIITCSFVFNLNCQLKFSNILNIIRI